MQVIDERLAFLTPILKGFLTEVGKEAADLGIQAYGGHGYIKDNKAEQVFRDVRIAALWEGTTQIQALDLLGRKIMLQKLKPIAEHCAELRGLCQVRSLPSPFSILPAPSPCHLSAMLTSLAAAAAPLLVALGPP